MLYLLWLCLCAHRAVGVLLHFVVLVCECLCVAPWGRGLLVQSAYLLTCGTIYLSSLIWFDCIPPASVSANSPQCDSVVWHKVMKTHKALITCQWLWGWAVVDLYAHRHTQARRHTHESMLSHNCTVTHTCTYTQPQTHTCEPEACCSLNYSAVIMLWLMVPPLMAAIW